MQNFMYVLVVTLSINDIIKFLENIKQRYRSEITRQRKNNNWDYLIDATFRNINKDCFYFYSKMVVVILQEILLISITYQW